MKIEKYKKDGKTLYKFRAYMGYDETGKQIRVQKGGFETKREAELAYSKIVTYYTENKKEILKPIKELTLEQVYKEYINLKTLELQESSLIKIERCYLIHIAPKFGNIKVNKIQPKDIQDFVNNKYSTYSAGYKIVQQFKSILNFAMKKEYLKNDILKTVIIPKRKKKEEKFNYYTKEELKQFLVLAKEQLSHQWYVFFYLLAHTGLRRGEALALQWDCLKENSIIIRRAITQTKEGQKLSNITKNQSSYRTVLISQELKNLLLTLQNCSESTFIFTNTKNSFYTPSQPLRQLGKIKEIRQISPHGFRHTHCSLLFSAGVGIPEVQKRLGHADISTTIQIYNHVYKEDEMKALKKYKNFLLEE